MKAIIKFILNNIPRKRLQRVVHLVTPVLGLAYTGRGVECPVCGARYRKFMPYGYVNPRSNALCPRCLSLERHRLMWLYLKRETDFFSVPARVLHIAPEYCFIKRFEAFPNLDYITADLESPLAAVLMDVQKIPFEDNSFDIVFCNHILEHVEDDRLAMREIRRVLRPGGYGIILSPVNPEREITYEDPSITDPEERLRHFGQKDHMREYGTDFGDRLRSQGLRVEEIDYACELTSEEAFVHGLRREIIYLVRK